MGEDFLPHEDRPPVVEAAPYNREARQQLWQAMISDPVAHAIVRERNKLVNQRDDDRHWFRQLGRHLEDTLGVVNPNLRTMAAREIIRQQTEQLAAGEEQLHGTT